MTHAIKDPVTRISISLPSSLVEQLDRMVLRRELANRSQAIADMIATELDHFHQEAGSTVMAGTITLFYDETRRGLQARLAEIQREHVDAVISSQHILLEDNHVMEVLVVQGPADRLERLVDLFTSCKGVKTGKLNLSSILLPPLHGR